MNGWTLEWPTEPGWYWFLHSPIHALAEHGEMPTALESRLYRHPEGIPKQAKPLRLAMCQVRLDSAGHPVVTGLGTFIYAAERVGWWRACDAPEIPDSLTLDALKAHSLMDEKH